jgi:hypothetical protein
MHFADFIWYDKNMFLTSYLQKKKSDLPIDSSILHNKEPAKSPKETKSGNMYSQPKSVTD